jgi:hypothetical protein
MRKLSVQAASALLTDMRVMLSPGIVWPLQVVALGDDRFADEV